MANFSKYRSKERGPKKVVPSEIYNGLDRKSEAGPLRPIQEHILSTWYQKRREDKDTIVKLHTGAGKTLIGLLMGLSYINSGDGPVLYVCPNIYLMQQVCADAEKFGVPYCFLEKDQQELSQDFTSGKKILITYVQKVFNGLSIFGIGGRSLNVGCIILDDSHACMDAILNACTINIEKKKNTDLYSEFLSLFSDNIKQQGEGTYQDILQGRYNEGVAIPYWAWYDKRDTVAQLLSNNTDNNNIKFAWPTIKNQLGMCRAFISSRKVEISPECIPIRTYGVFNNANHRILMSATTQEDTLFIKGMGLSSESISNPLIDENYHWSGEKMLLIPSLICENTPVGEIEEHLLSDIHPKFGLAVLVPSFDKAKKYTDYGAKLVHGSEMYQIMQDFKKPSQEIVDNYRRNAVFANRYDGIDLPDETCRVLIIDSLPHFDSLADTYEEICRVNSDIVKIKIAQKIEQGLGRSVRGEKDYSVIIILGNDLIKYLRSASNKSYFSPQTQKQIDVGFEIASMDEDGAVADLKSLKETINQCIDRDDDWKVYYKEKMDEIILSDVDRSTIYAILEDERKAYEHLLAGDYSKACEKIQSVVNRCDEPNEKSWYMQLLAKYKYPIERQTSAALQYKAFVNNNELMKPTTEVAFTKLEYAINEKRTERIKNKLSTYSSYSDFILSLEELLGRLTFGTSANSFEHALDEVGKLLGYMCQRPDKTYRKGPDNLWCDDRGSYLLLECKSEVSTTRDFIHKSEAGQVDQHCGWFEEKYNGIRYNTCIIIPTNKLAADAYFTHGTRVITERHLSILKSNIREFFAEFRGYQMEDINSETIARWISLHHLETDKFIANYSIDAV